MVRARLAWPAGQSPPILLVGAPAGGGKTTFLRQVEEVTEQLHAAYVDLAAGRLAAAGTAAPGRSPVAALLTVLVYELMGHRANLRRLSFPRYVLGLLALQPVPSDRRDVTRRTVQRLLDDQKRPKLPEDVRELAAAAADAVAGALGTTAAGVGDVLVSALTSGLSRRRTAGERWWAQRGRPAADVLVELNSRIHEGPASHRWAQSQELLVRAFLADLRASYAERWWRPSDDFTTVVLLDNVEHGAGWELLDLIARVRRETPEPDPLTVIAAAGAPCGSFTFDGTDSARAGGEAPPGPDRAGAGVDPRPLPGLTVAETALLAEQHDVRDPAVVAALHRLTRGHPGGLVWLLRHDPTLAALRQDEPGPDGVRPAARLVAELLPRLAGPDGTTLRRLVHTSAADRLTATTEHVATEGTGLELDFVPLRTALVGGLWAYAQGDGGGPAELHPFLRRVLLLRLQAEPAAWEATHQRLQLHHEHRYDRDRARYHALARCRIDEVTTALYELLSDDAKGWLAAFDATVAAPNPLSGPLPAEPDTLVEPVRRTAPALIYPLARLVAGEWLRADPLGPGGPRLDAYVRRRYGDVAAQVARSHPALSEALYARHEELPG